MSIRLTLALVALAIAAAPVAQAAELGYPEIPSVFFSFNARAGTPRPLVDKPAAAAAKALQSADVKARLQKVGYDPVDQPREAALRNLIDQNKFYADVVRPAGIAPQ